MKKNKKEGWRTVDTERYLPAAIIELTYMNSSILLHGNSRTMNFFFKERNWFSISKSLKLWFNHCYLHLPKKKKKNHCYVHFLKNTRQVHMVELQKQASPKLIKPLRQQESNKNRKPTKNTCDSEEQKTESKGGIEGFHRQWARRRRRQQRTLYTFTETKTSTFE